MCRHLRSSLHLAIGVKPPSFGLWLHLDVNSDSLVAGSLRSSTSDAHTFLQKHDERVFRVIESI
jgi:hypothetical protein